MEFEVAEISVNSKTLKGLKIIGDEIQQRNDTHTIILLDTSGSMEYQRKLTNVKKSLHFLLKFLQKTDSLSLVTFNAMSSILIDNMRVTPEYADAFRYTIDTLFAEGGTNLSAGLLNVKGILERCEAMEIDDSIKTGLIILTDGHTNEGLTRSDDILRIIASMKEINPNLSITTIGYNDDHNAILLKSIATNGGGSYNIVNDIEQVATVFGDILGGLMTTVAQNVEVTYPTSWVSLNPYKKTVGPAFTTMYIGDICAESETILLFENTDASNVSVDGVNVHNFNVVCEDISWFSVTATVTSTATATEKDNYHIAYIRLTIANILEHMETLDKVSTLTTLDAFKTYLNQATHQSHPLVSILKKEITSIEEQLSNNDSNLNLSQNLQTSAFLGLSRGTITNRRNRMPAVPQMQQPILFTPVSSFGIDDVINNFGSINIATPFSNRIQREITQQAYSCTTQDPN